MKVIANRLSLLEGLKAVSAAVKSRTPKPILACVLIRAESDHLMLYTTDLETSIQWKVSQVQIEQTGVCAVNAEKIVDAIDKMSSDIINIELKSAALLLTDKDGDAELNIADPKDMPPFIASESAETFSVSAAAISSAIAKVFYASTNALFPGVYFDCVKGMVSVCATDGKRLVMVDLGKIGVNDRAGCMVGRTEIIAKLSAEKDELLSICIGDTRCRISTDMATLEIPVLERPFPPYRDYIPETFSKVLTCDRDSLLSAMRRAMVLCDETTISVKMELGKHGVRILSRSAAVGSGIVSVPAKYEGADLVVGVNAKYVAESLASSDADEVTWEFNDGKSAMMLSLDAGHRVMIGPVILD